MTKEKIFAILKLKKVQAAIFAVIAAAGLTVSPEMRETVIETIGEVVTVIQSDDKAAGETDQ